MEGFSESQKDDRVPLFCHLRLSLVHRRTTLQPLEESARLYSKIPNDRRFVSHFNDPIRHFANRRTGAPFNRALFDPSARGASPCAGDPDRRTCGLGSRQSQNASRLKRKAGLYPLLATGRVPIFASQCQGACRAWECGDPDLSILALRYGILKRQFLLHRAKRREESLSDPPLLFFQSAQKGFAEESVYFSILKRIASHGNDPFLRFIFLRSCVPSVPKNARIPVPK